MNDKPNFIQQLSSTVSSHVCLTHHSAEEGKTILEVETNANDDRNRFISDYQKEYDWSEFITLVEAINSEDQSKQSSGLIGLRRLLNDEDAPFDKGRIQKVIDAGLIPKLLEFLKKDNEPKLQEEAIWALSGITGGTSDQVEEVIAQGAAPLLIRLLKPCHSQLFEYTAMAIGNIAAAPSHRNILLDSGALHPLIDVLKGALVKKDTPLIRQGTRALSNLNRGRPLPAYERVADATLVLCAVVQEVPDIDILQDAIWALFYLSNGEEKVTRVLEADGIVPSLIRYLDCSDISVSLSTLRTLGNIVAGSDDQADVVLKGSSARKYVKKLFQLLKHDKKSLRKDVCWSLSNITCRRDTLDLVIGNPEYTEQLVNVALYDALNIQKEAIWALSNATVDANKNQMMSMIRNGVFDCLGSLVQQASPADTIAIGLKGLQKFLAFGASMSRKEATNNKCLIKLKQKGAINKIKKLRGSRNSELSELTIAIWNKYLKVQLLRKKLRLKRAIICFKNERHSLHGLFQNKKKKLSV